MCIFYPYIVRGYPKTMEPFSAFNYLIKGGVYAYKGKY